MLYSNTRLWEELGSLIVTMGNEGVPISNQNFSSKIPLSLWLQFWESTIVWRPSHSGTNETYPVIAVTNFRVHPTYSRYVTWSKLIVQCVLPVALLVFFNR